MNPLVEQDPSGPVVQSTFAVLTLGRLALFIRRDDIRTLETVDDMQPATTQAHELGWYEVQGEQVPVFGLDEKLQRLPQRPASRRVAVVVSANAFSMALLCDDIVFLDANEVSLKQIPECMGRRRPLVTGLTIYNDAVGCVTTSESLATYFLQAATT